MSMTAAQSAFLKRRHSPGWWQVMPWQHDHGGSLAICDANSRVIALIPPLNEDDDPDWDTARRDKHDLANAALFAAAPKLLDYLEIMTAAMENVLLHNKPMSEADLAGRRKIVAEAQEAIRAALTPATKASLTGGR